MNKRNKNEWTVNNVEALLNKLYDFLWKKSTSCLKTHLHIKYMLILICLHVVTMLVIFMDLLNLFDIN